MMNRCFTLLLAANCLTAVGQECCGNYNSAYYDEDCPGSSDAPDFNCPDACQDCYSSNYGFIEPCNSIPWNSGDCWEEGSGFGGANNVDVYLEIEETSSSSSLSITIGLTNYDYPRSEAPLLQILCNDVTLGNVEFLHSSECYDYATDISSVGSWSSWACFALNKDILRCGVNIIALQNVQCDGVLRTISWVSEGECGCTDENACNFEPDAWYDDGSCYSCDIPSGHCGIGTIWDPYSQTCIVDESACGWQPDGNGDNLIGVNDLLDLLGVYGDTDYDQDGIWDSADDCVGEYDECGVCNGSGPSIPIIESIEILYDSVYAEPIDEWLVFEVGADTTFSYTCFEWQCGDPLEYQGYEYETVQIGEQCWFAENLRAENYRGGGSIQSNVPDETWTTMEYGACCVYGEGSSTCQSAGLTGDPCDESWSLSEFGRLYNWFSVIDSSGLCPSGWMVPNHEAWNELLDFVGGVESGNELKEQESWIYSNGAYVGENSVGFNGKASGARTHLGNYGGVGQQTGWWCSTPLSGTEGGEVLLLSYSNYFVDISQEPYVGLPNRGRPIRCIKDAE